MLLKVVNPTLFRHSLLMLLVPELIILTFTGKQGELVMLKNLQTADSALRSQQKK